MLEKVVNLMEARTKLSQVQNAGIVNHEESFHDEAIQIVTSVIN